MPNVYVYDYDYVYVYDYGNVLRLMSYVYVYALFLSAAGNHTVGTVGKETSLSSTSLES
jgi:hypothetical protein